MAFIKRNRLRWAKSAKQTRDKRRKLTRRLKLHQRVKLVPKTTFVEAHIACHLVFDRLWCGPRAPMSRNRAYEYLAKITGRSNELAHIRFLGPGECYRVIAMVKQSYPQLFRHRRLDKA